MSPDEQEGIFNHTMMSPETKEKLNTIEQELKEVRSELGHQDIKAAERSKDIEFIKTTLARIESSLMKVIEDKKEEHMALWGEIKPMRDWQIKVGTKIAMWSGLGTFAAGTLSSLLIWYLTK